jgi:hypothetical protein
VTPRAGPHSLPVNAGIHRRQVQWPAFDSDLGCLAVTDGPGVSGTPAVTVTVDSEFDRHSPPSDSAGIQAQARHGDRESPRMQLEEAAAGRGPGAPRPPVVPGAGVGTPSPGPSLCRAPGRLPVARRPHESR